MTDLRAALMVSVTLVVPGVTAVGAQEPPPLRLSEVVESALGSHPAIAGASAGLAGAEAGVGQARSSRLPTVSALLQGTQYEEPMVVAPLHGFDPQNPPHFDERLYQGHASVDWVVYDGGARASRIAAAEAGAGAAGAALDLAREAIVADAVIAYLAVLSAAEVREATDRQVTALSAELERSRLMLQEGKSARVAVLRTEAALGQARARWETADERHRLALHRLARVSGLDPARIAGAALRPAAAPEGGLPSRAALLEEATRANARVSAARERLLAAERAVGVARAAFMPTVSMAGRYSAFGSASTDPALEWQAGVQVRYPVFTGGARARGVEQARAQAESARAETALAEREVEDAVDRALLAHRSASARVEALESTVAQAAEVARIEALALREGAGTQTDYLRAEAALLEASAGLAEARHAVVEARVRIAQATGRLTPGWVARLTEETEP